jgi:hypothetical protein
MLDMFDKDPTIQTGSIILPQFIYVRGALVRDVERVVQYYRQSATWVDNSHLLVLILHNLNVSLRRSTQRYVDTVRDGMGQVANMLRLTNSLGYGKVHTPGVFYGQRATEIIIADDSEFDIGDAVLRWRDLRPVRVLRHAYTDLSLSRGIGRRYGGSETGIAVISINIPMLALQYREWCREERMSSDGVAQRTHQFISQYPLTNMLYSHLDIAVFNRMAAMYYLDDVAPWRKCHPFYLQDLSDTLDPVLERELAMLRRKPLSMDQVVNIIPAINMPTLRDTMRLPEVVPTRQVRWGLTIARLPLIRFLVNLNADMPSSRNRGYLNKLSLTLRAIRNDRGLSNVLPPAIYHDVDDMIHRDIERYL